MSSPSSKGEQLPSMGKYIFFTTETRRLTETVNHPPWSHPVKTFWNQTTLYELKELYQNLVKLQKCKHVILFLKLNVLLPKQAVGFVQMFVTTVEAIIKMLKYIAACPG